MAREMDIKDGVVRVWWDDRWEYDDEDEDTFEVAPDVVMTDERARWFVTEFLRGPMGPVGPMGAQGIAGRDA